MASAFANTDEWQKQTELLKEILTEDEYKSARSVTNNAFYTSPKIASTMWQMLQRLAELNGKADLIAAFKLPSQTFEKNAGASATSDILILQKRLDPKTPSEHAQSWNESGEINVELPDHFGNGSHPVPFGVPAANKELVKDFVALKKALDNILKAQLSPETTNEKLSQLREILNKNYDEFVSKHGYLKYTI